MWVDTRLWLVLVLLVLPVLAASPRVQASHAPTETGTDTKADNTKAETEADKAMADGNAAEVARVTALLRNSPRVASAAQLQMLQEAARRGNEDALLFLGRAYLIGDHDLAHNYTAAREHFLALADHNNCTAYSYLGFMAAHGIGMPVDQAKAMVYYSFGALGNDTMAQMSLGYRYLNGIGTMQSCESSAKFYHAAADKVAAAFKRVGGLPQLKIRLLDEQYGSPQVFSKQDLLQYYQYTADKGDASAQLIIGQLYQQGGQGVQQNMEAAIHFLRKAAELGNGQAAALLGYMYLGGEGVPVDNSTAIKFFRAGAVAESPAAYNGMGLVYLQGAGVARDLRQAAMFFKKAADAKHSDAQVNLAVMIFNGLGGFKRDNLEVIKLLSAASQSGHVLGQYYLGVMHYYGLGTAKSCAIANTLFKIVAERGDWTVHLTDQAYNAYHAHNLHKSALLYLLAAEQGYEVAQSNIAFMLEQGFNLLSDENENSKRALTMWIRAGSQGFTQAKVKVGDAHYYGQGTPVNYPTAAAYYMLADQEQSAQAMFNLGFMHEYGIGVEKDLHMAKRFYDKAIATSTDAYFPASLTLVVLLIKMAVLPLYERSFGWVTKAETDWESLAASVLVITLVLLVLARLALVHQGVVHPPRLPHAPGMARPPQQNERRPNAPEQPLQAGAAL